METDESVVNGATFLVTDGDGSTDRPHDGFYHRDTQYLDAYSFDTDPTTEPLDTAVPRPGERLRFAGTPLAGGWSRDAVVRRHQVVDDGLAERIRVESYASEPRTFRLELSVGTRFDDLFEVRGIREARSRTLTARPVEGHGDGRDGTLEPGDGRDDTPGPADAADDRRTGGRMEADGDETKRGGDLLGTTFAYEPRDVAFDRATTVVTDARRVGRAVDVVCGVDDDRARGRIAVELALEPGEETTFHVAVRPDHAVADPRRAFERAREAVVARAADWRDAVDVPTYSPWAEVLSASERGLLELSLDTDHGPVLAAGVPWYATVFGRDSILAAYMALPVRPGIAAATCRHLAERQATATDAFTAAEPGRILHEEREGETTRRGETPHAPYYGTVDATALFVVLAHETWRWTGDDGFARDLLPSVDAAIGWIDDAMGESGRERGPEGFLAYPFDDDAELRHQGWKDSDHGVVHPDGADPEGPIALAEVQGYVYDAKRRAGDLAVGVTGDEAYGARLREEAATLRGRFDDAFWLPDEGTYAVALDGASEPVSTVTSNPGHCLWSGIVPERRADDVIDRLRAPDLDTGWGIRTLSSVHDAYNPVSYHLGSVWPHDTALAALGMDRYGRRGDARDLASGLIAAARCRSSDRLPELFAGFDRADTTVPVAYGDACEPQAWAAAAPFALLRAIGEVSGPAVPFVDR